MISERISDDIPPQVEILNLVISINAPLQFHLKFEGCKPHKAAHSQKKCDLINEVKLFLTVYRRQIFDIIQSDVALQKQVH